MCSIDNYSLIADLYIFVYGRAEYASISLECTKVKLFILNNFDKIVYYHISSHIKPWILAHNLETLPSILSYMTFEALTLPLYNVNQLMILGSGYCTSVFFNLYHFLTLELKNIFIHVQKVFISEKNPVLRRNTSPVTPNQQKNISVSYKDQCHLMYLLTDFIHFYSCPNSM